MPTDYRKLYAMKKRGEMTIRALCPLATEDSGIYCFYRTDENGIKHAYVGQARHLLSRMAEHLVGYQYIDLSIKKHGLYSQDNVYGYQASVLQFCPRERLDEWEQHYIREWATNGYQMKNRTSGSQGKGKQGIAEQKPARGYYDGKRQGYLDARKYIAKLFEKNLTVLINGKETANKQKAMQKFVDFITIEGGAADE